jgi:outer membrane protein assembly factor BamB
MATLLAACGGSGSNAGNTANVPAVPTSTDVVTQHNDIGRTGLNLTETILTPANVAPAQFGLLRILTVTGKVDAQPLYLSHLTINGSVHNVVFIATEHALVYAFDADTGEQLWQVSLVGSGETPAEPLWDCGQVSPEIGITSTPVIDRSQGPNGTLYVVVMSSDASTAFYQRIHALDVATGAEQSGSPQRIAATYQTNGQTSTYNGLAYKERAALLLVNGVIYTSWASHCDTLPYGGWILGYDQKTLQQVSVLDLEPSAQGAAIWQAGGGPAADSAGNIYVLTANGTFDTNLNAQGFPTSGDYGNSLVKIATANATLAVADYFSMYLSVYESSLDLDLGSSGPMLLPDEIDSTGAVRHLAVGAGKDGNVYVVDRDNMSKFNPVQDHPYEVMAGATPGQVFASPAYFNHTLYYGDVQQGTADGTLKAFALNAGQFPSEPTTQTATGYQYPGASPAVSANGTKDAIVWASENTSPAVLHAYDATNLAIELYNSTMAPSGRDNFGNGNKYITPTIADGKVFVATQDGVGVFGLLQ